MVQAAGPSPLWQLNGALILKICPLSEGEFLLFSKLLEILILKHISRVPPCEASRPELSENVVVFGPRSFRTGVIAAQS